MTLNILETIAAFLVVLSQRGQKALNYWARLYPSLWKKCNAPVLFVDRQEYIEGILDSVSGRERARIALAKMIRRGEENPRQFQ